MTLTLYMASEKAVFQASVPIVSSGMLCFVTAVMGSSYPGHWRIL